MTGEKREITGVHDISGTIYREVGPAFKKVLGTDAAVDDAGIRRIWHRGPRKTELLTWETEEGAIVRQELTFQHLLIETNQTGLVRTGKVPKNPKEGSNNAVKFSSGPDHSSVRKCAMLLANMKQRDAYQHHLLVQLNTTLDSLGYAEVNVLHGGPHNLDPNYHDSLVETPPPAMAEEPADSISTADKTNYWLQIALGIVAVIAAALILSR